MSRQFSQNGCLTISSCKSNAAITPSGSETPSTLANLLFLSPAFSQIDDCTLEWTFEPNSLDYVHIRFLSGSIPDWTRLFEQAYRCLKPGGYIESMEPSPIVECDDGTINDKSAMSQWGKIFIQGGINSGRTWTVVRDHVQEKAMKEAGFTEVEATTWKVFGSIFSDVRSLLT